MISTEVIKMASDTSNYGIKRKSNYIATCKNKICGDKITVEIEISNNIVKKMYYETESCIFCQASASLLSKLIKKSNIQQLSLDIKNIKMLYKKKNIILKNKYKSFKKLFQLKYKKRFNCVMLPFNALLKAVNNII